MTLKYRTTLLSFAVFAVGVFSYFFAVHFDWDKETSLAAPGTFDFIAFWDAAKFFSQGDNPYQFGLYGRNFHNPPWLLPLLLPLSKLPFDTARLIWFGLSSLAGLSAILILCAHYRRKFSISTILLLLAFPPLLDVLFWGNLSAWAGLGACGFLWAYQSGRQRLAGMFLFLLSLKPQIILIPAVFLLQLFFTRRNFVPILVAGASILLLSCTAEVVRPGTFIDWWQNLPISWEHVIHSRSASFPQFVNVVLEIFKLPQSDLLYRLVPLLTVVATGILAFLKRQHLNLEQSCPYLLALGVFAAPYAWFHDSCVLLPLAGELLLGPRRNERVTQLVQLMWLAMFAFTLTSEFYFRGAIWFIFALTWLVLVTRLPVEEPLPGEL